MDPTYERWACFLDRTWAQDPVGVHEVLDVACGTGLLGIELQSMGYRVTGVDASAAMLARARRRLGPAAVLVRDTLPVLTPRGPFDAAVSTFDGLNYLTPLDLRATMAAVAGTLRRDGWFVFDLHTDAMMRFTAANPVVSGMAEGMAFTIRSDVNPGARTCATRIEVTRTADGDRFTEHHRQYFFSDDQVRTALAAAGFDLIAVTEEYTPLPAGPDTLRATWIARLRGHNGDGRAPANPGGDELPR